MARVDVVMPQMGESIAEGTLSKWLKKVGDQVKRDEPIFEISTDKVDAEIPSPTSGVLAEILVTEGQTVAVQTVVARLETDVNAAVAAPAAAAPAPAAAAATAARRAERAGGSSGSSRRAGATGSSAWKRELVRGSAAHEVVAARSANGGRARRRDQRAERLRHRRPRHEEGPRRLPRVGRQGAAARRAPARRRLRQPLDTVRCPSRGPAIASSRCRRCARSSPSTWWSRGTRRRT